MEQQYLIIFDLNQFISAHSEIALVQRQMEKIESVSEQAGGGEGSMRCARWLCRSESASRSPL